MAVRTFEDHVSELLAGQLVEPKTLGIPNASKEATSVFESIALSLLLKPRAALYIEQLARNGLVAAVNAELALCDQLKADIQDLANLSYKIEGGPVLQRARTALLQVESLPRISNDATALGAYRNSIDEFLEKYLSKNVRRRGSTEMVRPSEEAQGDLLSTFSALKDAHDEVWGRLLSLDIGIDNFLLSPLSAVIGTSAAAKARVDLESIIEHVETSGDASIARDIAVRLIGSRSSLDVIATLPSPTSELFPQGTIGETGATKVVAKSGPGPFYNTVAVLSVTVNGETEAFNFFPTNVALLVSRAVTFPLTVPGGALILSLDGASPVSVPLGPATFNNLTELQTALAGNAAGLQVAAYVDPTRLLFTAPALEFAILPAISGPMNLSDYFGLRVGDVGSTETDPALIVEAVNALFSIVSAQQNEDGTFSIVSEEDGAGISMTVSASPSFGMGGTHTASSPLLRVGTGDQRELAQPGDLITVNATKTAVSEVDETNITLAAAVPGYSGVVTGESALALVHGALQAELAKVLPTWRASVFSEDLTTLDRVLAPLGASAAPAQRNAAIDEVERLKTLLSLLLSALTAPSTMLPDGAAAEERRVVEGIVTTLTERNYDRAVDLLLRCDIQSLVEMDLDNASYGSKFLKSMSATAPLVVDTRDTVDDPTIPNDPAAGHF